jgi:hypothetical protein
MDSAEYITPEFCRPYNRSIRPTKWYNFCWGYYYREQTEDGETFISYFEFLEATGKF